MWILWIHDPFLDLPRETKNPFLDSEIRIWIFPNKTHLWFNAYWLNLNRDVILLKRWFLRKEVVTDIVIQGVYLPKKLRGVGGGGVKYQNILATIDRVWRGCLGIHDLTEIW